MKQINLAEQLFLTNVEEIVRSYYHNADEGVDSILLQIVDAHGTGLFPRLQIIMALH